MNMKCLDFDLSLKKVHEDGSIEGYGSVFDVVDSWKEVVAKGAFVESLKSHKVKGRMPAMLWQHDMADPIGVWQNMSEDDRGLYVNGKLALDTQKGREAHSLLKQGALSGLSIGFMPKKSQFNEGTGIKKLLEVDLWEVSLVTFPANDAARITEVRAENIKTIRDFEKLLREECGFSRRQAKALASGGWPALDVAADGWEDPEDEKAAQNLLKLMRGE